MTSNRSQLDPPLSAAPTHRWRAAAVITVGVALAAIYAATLQTGINGSSDEYMIDVGEIQVALNVWGTIHHTGYPLFAILGNLFTLPLRALDLVAPAGAASLYATAWGVVALAAFGALLARLTRRPLLAAGITLVLGVTRSVWIHNVIAEVYSMSLAITALLYVVALWPAPWSGAWSARRRILWLALLGGIGVAHHRAVAFIAPGLLLAIAPEVIAATRRGSLRWRRTLPQAVALALLGFLPYVYLPLRARMDAAWVYGEPGTWNGFWTEFTGREANRLVTLAEGASGWLDNFTHALSLLAGELTLPGLLIAAAGLLAALIGPRHRHAARVIALGSLGPFLFAVAYRTAVLPEAILMPVVMGLLFGLGLALDTLLAAARDHQREVTAMTLIGLAIWAGGLAAWRYPAIDSRVNDPTGEETIARLHRVPAGDGAVFMLPWGPRHSAAAYAHLVTHEIPDVTIVDHKADYRALLVQGRRLFTEPETFYTYPPPWATPYGPPSNWWTDRLDALHLRSAAPGIVEIGQSAWAAGDDPADGSPPDGTPLVYGIIRERADLRCDDDTLILRVVWRAGDQPPDANPSVFVHLTGDTPAPDPPNADRPHPVYGLYPFAQWSAGEPVTDHYMLPRLPDKTQVRFGLYEQNPDGSFANYGETSLPVTACSPAGSLSD